MKFWLLTLLFLPLIPAVVLIALRRAIDQFAARRIALAGSLIALSASLMVAYELQSLPTPSAGGSPIQPRFDLQHTWLTIAAATENTPAIELKYHIGIDGIGLLLIVLTTLLNVASVLISWDAIRDRAANFYCCILL